MMNTIELQKLQDEYDKKHFEHNNKSQFEQIRHITLHAMKLRGKLAAYCEEKEHNKNVSTEKIIDEVVPDLLVFSLQLGNIFGLDLEKSYLKRLKDNIKRLTKVLDVNKG